MRYVDGFVIPVPKNWGLVSHGDCDSKSIPFNVKRMGYGGFKVLVDV